MCTLTIIERHGGYRVVVNRDEKRTRPAAEPPERRRAQGVRALWPVDPLAGGSWIAVSDRGVTISVQNVSPTPYPTLPEALVSRGLLIPRLIGAHSAAHAVEALSRLALGVFAPFRVVAVDHREIADATWDRRSLRTEHRALGPACFVTSGLGDCRAAPRLDLWREFLRGHGATASMQDEFHRHTWPDRPEISVHMSRVDARTVCTTIVEVASADAPLIARMTHRDDAGVSRAELPALAVVAAGAALSDTRAAC